MTTATYDRAAIMRETWSNIPKGYFSLSKLARELRIAWFNAKMALRRAQQTEAERIQEQLSTLEAKDRWNQNDHAKASELRQALDVARQHEANAEAYATKRALIASAKGRFCSVAFIKADGTKRVMSVQPSKLAKHVKGDEASQAGRKAAATRQRRHPNLLPVWDAQAQAPRSINLATVTSIQVDGAVHTYGHQTT